MTPAKRTAGRPRGAVPAELERQLVVAARELAAAERAVDRKLERRREVALEAHAAGGSVRAIATLLGVSSTTVSRLLEDV